MILRPSRWRLCAFAPWADYVLLLMLFYGVLLAGCLATYPPAEPAPGEPEIPTMSRYWSPFVPWHAIAAATAPVPGQDYSVLTVCAGLCTLIAVLSILASAITSSAKIRTLAATAIATAVGLWALRVLLVKYLGIAIGIAVTGSLVAGLVFAGLFVWGHRAWIQRKTGVDFGSGESRGGGHLGPLGG